MRISDWSSDVCSSDLRSSRSQHGIDDQSQALVELAHQAFQIGLRFQCFFVAGNAHGTDLGTGYKAKHPIQHAYAGPQYRNDSYFFSGQLLDIQGAGPALDAGWLQDRKSTRLNSSH